MVPNPAKHHIYRKHIYNAAQRCIQYPSNSVSSIIDISQGPKYVLDTAATLKLQTAVIVNTKILFIFS